MHPLITSRARLAILTRTHLAPDQEFYLRELVRATGLAPRTVQVELDRLVDAEILTERRDGNRRYLRAEKGHPLFAPVREIVLKTAGIVPLLRAALDAEGVQIALVFGSIATGTAGAGSDVDLLVVGSIGLRNVVRRVREAQHTFGREINPVVWTPDEFRRRRRQGDHFLTQVLASPRLMVIGSDRELDELGRERLASAPSHIARGDQAVVDRRR